MTTEIESQVTQHNCNDYKSWSYQEAAEWIISVNSSKFEKYRGALNNSFSAKNINFESIAEDEDLKQYGITDSNDRKTIYTAITQLISTQNSLADSQDTQTFENQDKEIEITQLSASDDEEEDEPERDYSQGAESSFSDTEDEKRSIDDDANVSDKEDENKSSLAITGPSVVILDELVSTFDRDYNDPIEEDEEDDNEHKIQGIDDEMDKKEYHLELQRQSLMENGYCKWMSDKSYKEIMITLTSGYVREYYEADQQFPLKLNQDIFRVIREFYGVTFGIGDHDHVKLKISYLGVDHLYLTTITNISLSKLLSARLEASSSNTIMVDKVPCQTLEHVLTYLGHHKGVEPDPLPCPVRSIHMSQIVSDKWDATWIDAFDKKTIFEVILAAHHLDINCLLHLGSAKIATLIKQLDQKEINRIIEEEEKYRREHASNNNDTNNSDDDDDEDDEDEDDEDDQKEAPLITAPTGPSIMMLDELVSIFDHDCNDQIEADEENDNEQRIQGINDNEERSQEMNEEKNKKGYTNPTIEMLGELLDIFDY